MNQSEHTLLKLLKARVDQFPAVEQELVQMRNRHDREVRRFHDINLYTERLFEQSDPKSVLKITAEGLVDIFDLEVSGILQLADDGETLLPLAYVGPDRPDETLHLDPVWKTAHAKPESRQAPAATVGPFLLDGPGLPKELADVIACPSYDVNGEIRRIYWAGVSHENASVYDRLGADRVSSFAIYCHQTMNMLAQIQNQVQLESALLAKTQFLRNMSHVLRTPLNAIIGFAHIAMGDHPKPSIRSSLDMIRSSSKTLLQQISHILDFNQLESRQLIIECAPFSMEEMIQTIRNMLELEAQKHELTLHFNIDRNIPELLVGDSLRLRQILINLVNNALEFTQEGTVSVTVHCRHQNDAQCTLEFSVQDTGIGMSDEQLARIFASFSQTSASTRHQTGLGLGLSLCQQIVVLMGGTLNVNSQVDEGTTFSFTITLDRPTTAGRHLTIR